MSMAQAKKQAFGTLFGDAVIAERKADIEEQFHYNINTKTLVATNANGGAEAVENDMLKMSTSTAINGSAQLETKKVIRYRPGFEGFSFFTALFESNPEGCIQRIGPHTSTDGYYIGYGTDGVFEVGKINGGVVTAIKQTNFNGDNRFTDIDLTKLNVFSIHYGWLGTAPIIFSVMLQDGQWITFHTEKIAGTETVPHSSNPQLPICVSLTKTSGATDVILRSGSWCGGVNGNAVGVADRFFSADQPKGSVSTEAIVMNLRIKSTFQSKTNRVIVELIKRNYTSDGTKNVIFRIYRNLTITGSPVWADIDSTNSVVEIDVAGTATFAVANQEDIIEIGKVDRDTEKIKGEGFEFYPGDIITVTAESSSNSDVDVSLRWREEF